MQGFGHQLLAGPRRAVDENGDIGGREPADGAKHLLHGRRPAEDFRLRKRSGAGLCIFHLNAGDGAPHHGHRFVDVEGFGQILKGAPMVGGHRAVEVGMGCHDDDRQVRTAPPQQFQEVEPVHARHADVRQHRQGRPAGQQGQGLVGAGEGAGGDAGAAHGLLQHPAYGAVVIDDPDGRLAGARRLHRFVRIHQGTASSS